MRTYTVTYRAYMLGPVEVERVVARSSMDAQEHVLLGNPDACVLDCTLNP